MGSAKSIPVTPVGPPLHNKHLARVSDPRSPSAGILRTPIQVESSPQPNLHLGKQLESPDQALDSDPRSPTLGIARTPMKTSSGEPPSPLMKQLSEVFENGAAKMNLTPEHSVHMEAPTSSALDLPLGNQFSLENQISPWGETELSKQSLEGKEEIGLPSDTSVTNQSSDKSLREPETPRSSGSKHGRRKPKGKVLGRSPLTILQDDNSPGTLTSRQEAASQRHTLHCPEGRRLEENGGWGREEKALKKRGRAKRSGMSSWPLLPPVSSVPDFKEAVPGTCGHSHPIGRDPQAADPVVVARQDT
ncbi:Cell division cycle-associated protein 3 [Galemys pyrenaicus]|uniref:Cell division cycle-associated protein 3 n=1 Tax=Galemys pyrenaicus TaxID=202257 RepID=A0A8J6A1X0_GALPY|nr:Cell division cycle-associated protein 3 [Galemys pyrenaicus]